MAEKQILKITDPLYSNQWNLQMLRIPEAWRYSHGKGVTIGLIDSGVDGSHEDLGWHENVNISSNDSFDAVKQKYSPVMKAIAEFKHPKILPGWNLVDQNNFTWDWHRHGTLMAGTIAAESDGFGMVGVAPLAKIRPYVVIDQDGQGSHKNIADAIVIACEDGCDVINISLQWRNGDDEVQRAINSAVEKDVVIVGAAGNYNSDELAYPARYKGVIAVGGCDSKGRRWVHSSKRGSNYGNGLECVCPATEQVTTKRMRSRFTKIDATSQACAHMTGIVALMKSLDKGLSYGTVLVAIEDCSSNHHCKKETGWGVPNALKMVQHVAGSTPNTSVIKSAVDMLRENAKEMVETAASLEKLV